MSTVPFKVIVATPGLPWWVITDADEPTYGLTDGLRITRSTPEGDISPAQPNPATASFGIIAETVGDVIPALDIGTPVAVVVLLGAAHEVEAERLHGRITDLDVVPHPSGVLVNVTVTDYLADLAELPPYPAASWLFDTVDALTWLFDYYGMDLPPRVPLAGHSESGPGPSTWPYRGSVPEVLEGHLRQWAVLWPGLGIWGRYVIVPRLNPSATLGLDATHPYVLWPVATPAYQRTYRSAFVIDGTHVDVVGSFNRTKADAVTALDVVYYDIANEEGGAAGDPTTFTVGTGPVRATLETLLTDFSTTAFTAAVFLPASDADWRVESFTWHLKAEPPGTYLPNPDTNHPGVYLGGPIDITNIEPRWSPVGSTYRGILAGYTLTLERARPTVQLDLRDALAL